MVKLMEKIRLSRKEMTLCQLCWDTIELGIVSEVRRSILERRDRANAAPLLKPTWIFTEVPSGRRTIWFIMARTS